MARTIALPHQDAFCLRAWSLHSIYIKLEEPIQPRLLRNRALIRKHSCVIVPRQMSKERGPNPLTHTRRPNQWVQSMLYAPPRNRKDPPSTQRGCQNKQDNDATVSHGCPSEHLQTVIKQ